MRFDFDETFGEDYLHFYGGRFTDEQNDRDTEDIAAFLDLHEGMTVLDAPCGHGRISNRLAAKGMRVVGVDASDAFLAIARRDASGVEYRKGDLRALPVDGPFDAAISWFTSFGYFDDTGNKQVLAEYRRVLRPGGRLLIETQNRDEFVRRFTPSPFSNSVWVDDDVMIDTSEFDCIEGRIETDRVVVRDGAIRRSHHSVRLPSISELRGWLLDAGFAETFFRSRDNREPAIDRPRLVAIAIA